MFLFSRKIDRIVGAMDVSKLKGFVEKNN